MPYQIKKTSGSKPWCVFNKDTGDKKGCSKTEEDAIAHMRALYHAESGKPFTKKGK
jgi:hypothetical protein